MTRELPDPDRGWTKEELLQAVAAAVASARGRTTASERDRDVAAVAVRRWRSFARRNKRADATREARVQDLARGLLERFDPDHMDEPGWHTWSAEAVADLLDRATRAPAR